MAIQTSFDEINNLETIEMIGGDYQLLTINVSDGDGLPVDITTGTNKLIISPYGIPTNVSLEKVGTVTDTNQFTVDLELDDTKDLSGTYLYQLSHTDFLGKEFRRQGLMIIAPRIASS